MTSNRCTTLYPGDEEAAVEMSAPEMPQETAPATSTWARYASWNEAVEADDFDGTYASRSVYIVMDDDIVARIADRAGEAGDPQRAFIDMVLPTLYMPGESGHLLDLHVRRLRRWQTVSDDESPPPCLGILAF